MTDKQMEMLTTAIMRLVQGPLHGDGCQPGGAEAITLALAGGFGGTGGDSVASGLHDVAAAIRELAEAVTSNKQLSTSPAPGQPVQGELKDREPSL